MTPTHEWHYPGGGTVKRFDRGDGKQVIPFFKPGGQAGIPSGMKPPLYGQPDTRCTFVVEGEKCVDALRQMGVAAVTSQGGANRAKHSDWAALERVERVYILPDNDSAGESYASDVAAILEAQKPGRDIRVIHLDGLPDHGDIVDWVQARFPDWDGYRPDERIATLTDELRRAAKDAATPEKPRAHDFAIIKASEVEIQAVEWLWPGRIACGCINIIAGPGGLGKSMSAISMAATITNGGLFPFSREPISKGRVFWLSGEEDVSRQLAPRAQAAGADLDRLHFITGITRTSSDGEVVDGAQVRLSVDAHQIAGLKREHPDTRLIVIDPLSAFLDAKDAHREADVRQVLTPWVKASEETGIAVVFIAHWNKGKGTHVRDRLSGSTAIRNTARMVHVITENPDDENERLLLPEKNNLTDGAVPGLVFHIQSAELPIEGEVIRTGAVEWLRETEQTAREVAQSESGHTTMTEDAEAMLLDHLAHGSLAVKDLQRTATREGIGWKTVERAKQRLGIESKREGFGKGAKVMWTLPTHTPNDPIGLKGTSLRSMDESGGTEPLKASNHAGSTYSSPNTDTHTPKAPIRSMENGKDTAPEDFSL